MKGQGQTWRSGRVDWNKSRTQNTEQIIIEMTYDYEMKPTSEWVSFQPLPIVPVLSITVGSVGQYVIETQRENQFLDMRLYHSVTYSMRTCVHIVFDTHTNNNQNYLHKGISDIVHSVVAVCAFHSAAAACVHYMQRNTDYRTHTVCLLFGCGRHRCWCVSSNHAYPRELLGLNYWVTFCIVHHHHHRRRRCNSRRANLPFVRHALHCCCYRSSFVRALWCRIWYSAQCNNCAANFIFLSVTAAAAAAAATAARTIKHDILGFHFACFVCSSFLLSPGDVRLLIRDFCLENCHIKTVIYTNKQPNLIRRIGMF